MRNSEAQRYARWSLAAAGLLATVVAGVYARNIWLARQAEKKAPPAVPPTIEQLSNEFSFSKVEGQRTIYTVKASRATEFKEGSRNLLEDVAITVYGKKGDRDDTLQTKACDFISDTGKITCAGDVQINLQAAAAQHVSGNAIQAKTSAVTFDRDSGEARTEKPVVFKWPAGEGSSVGLNYDSNSGTLRLTHSVDLNLLGPRPAASENSEASAGKTVHLTSDRMSFQRGTTTVRMSGGVQSQQATHTLSADELALNLDPAFHARRLVASGNPQLGDSSPQGPMALSADEIASDLNPDGSVETIIASGNARGTRNTTAGEDGIEAGRIQLDLVAGKNVPRLLTASDGVTIKSTSAAENGGTRRVESDALEFHFSNDSRPGQTLIESVNTLAPGRVEWRNVSSVKGKPVPQTTLMRGRRIVLSFRGQNQLQQLFSTGDVQVTRKVGDAPEETSASRELTARFDGAGEWATIEQTGDVRFRDGQRAGQGERAQMDRSTDTLAVDGSVVLADGTTRTTAQSATFARGRNTLRADGHVLTTELRQSGTSITNFAPEPAHISAEHLVADTARGHAVYSGSGRLWQGQSIIEGDTIELDSPSHTLVAKGQVHGVFPQAPWSPKTESSGEQSSNQPPKLPVNRAPNQMAHRASGGSPGQNAPQTQLGRVQGQLLTYWENESRARIKQGARADSEQGSIQADQIDLFFSDAGAASGTKQLTRAIATGDVNVRQEDRRGTSNRAEYTASEGKFVLSEGKPTLYSSTGDSTTGRQLTFYFADDRIVVDSTDGPKTVTLHQVQK
ncbi:MAG TPA: LPS export ABC transporter periplasmic protein LptC [Candidatus Acidoferrales bacterium]|nr:LPS export ABC transporter periplasmic protein LptC [Candidatus Acidoferrales bacterium]